MASTAIDIAFTSQFDADVKMAYQRMGSLLGGTVYKRNITSAKDLTFQNMGKAYASTKSRHGQIPTADLSHTSATATPTDYYVASHVDNLDLLKTNIDEKMVVAKSNAAALGRKIDDIIITTLATGTNTGAITLTNSKTFRNGVLTAIKTLKRRDVGLDTIWGAAGPTFWAWLMCVTEFASRDYVDVGLPYKDAAGNSLQGKNWLGVNWIEHTAVTGEGTSTEYAFLYDPRSVGMAVCSEVKSEINYLPERDTNLVSSKVSVGTVLIDNNGIQKMSYDSTAALPTS